MLLCYLLRDKKATTLRPFFMDGAQYLKARATSRRQFTFYYEVPRNYWFSLYRPRKDERLSRPWSHPVVLNTGPLDWESSTLTTWPSNILIFQAEQISLMLFYFVQDYFVQDVCQKNQPWTRLDKRQIWS